MATNLIQEGKILELPVASGRTSGDPVVVGDFHGVCLIDRDTDGNATVQLEGVFDLSVTGSGAAGQPPCG